MYILGCSQTLQGPKQWDSLPPSDHDHARFCQTCQRDVFRPKTKQELLERANAQQCIALFPADFGFEPEDEKPELLIGDFFWPSCSAGEVETTRA